MPPGEDLRSLAAKIVKRSGRYAYAYSEKRANEVVLEVLEMAAAIRAEERAAGPTS